MCGWRYYRKACWTLPWTSIKHWNLTIGSYCSLIGLSFSHHLDTKRQIHPRYHEQESEKTGGNWAALWPCNLEGSMRLMTRSIHFNRLSNLNDKILGLFIPYYSLLKPWDYQNVPHKLSNLEHLLRLWKNPKSAILILVSYWYYYMRNRRNCSFWTFSTVSL